MLSVARGRADARRGYQQWPSLNLLDRHDGEALVWGQRRRAREDHGDGIWRQLTSQHCTRHRDGTRRDGTVHLVHRGWEVGDPRALGKVMRQVGGAIWIAALTTAVGFGALMFQDNPGVASIGTLASLGVLLVCSLSALLAGALLSIVLTRRARRTVEK